MVGSRGVLVNCWHFTGGDGLCVGTGGRGGRRNERSCYVIILLRSWICYEYDKMNCNSVMIDNKLIVTADSNYTDRINLLRNVLKD